MSKTDLPILEQRRIEANIIKPIFEEMVVALGMDRAKDILGTAIRKNAIEQGKAYADSQGQPTPLSTFHSLLIVALSAQILRLRKIHYSTHFFL